MTTSRKRPKKQNQKASPNRHKERQQNALSSQSDNQTIFVRLYRAMLQYPWISQTVLLVAACLLTYGWTLDVPFYLDDFSSIQENPSIFLWDGSLRSLYGSRFIAYLTFALNYKVHAFHVAGYHVVNTFIHLMNGLIILGMVNSFSRTPVIVPRPAKTEVYWAGLFAATIFIIHPLHIQAVTYIVQRMASLATLFYLLSMLGYLQARLSTGNWGRILWGAVCLLAMIAGFFTKQTTATLPVALILLEIAFFGINRKKSLWIAGIGGLLVLSAYIIIAIYVMRVNPFDVEAVWQAARENEELSRITYFATQMRVLWLYLKLFFIPVGFCMDYSSYSASRSFWELDVLIAAAGHMLVVAGGLFCLRRIPVFFFGIFFYYLAHAVESGIIPIRDVVFEHRAYLPDVGLVCILGWGTGNFFKSRRVWIRTIGVLVCIVLGYLCWQRNLIWRDPILLWQSNVDELPNNKRAWEMLGKFYIEAQKYEESLYATRHAGHTYINEKGEKTYSYSHEALLNLIVANIRLKRYDMAKRLVEDGLLSEMNPLNKSKLLTNYGNIFGLEGKLVEAEKKYREALSCFPGSLPARINLGSILANSNRFDEALQMWGEASKIDPDNTIVQKNLVILKEKIAEKTGGN